MNKDKVEKAEMREQAPVPAAKSKGEKAFDRFVYGLVAGVGTFVVTVPVTYLLKHHPSVKPYFERAVNSLHARLPETWSRKTADKILSTTALMQGGNLMLLPVGLLEKHKLPIVKGLNVALDDSTPVEQIEIAPKQTWRSLLESRGLAWLAVFSSFKLAEKYASRTLEAFEEDMGELACRVFRKGKMKDVVEVVDGVKTIVQRESKTYLFGKIGAWDMFATAAAVTLAYIGGHFFARKQEQKKELKQQRHQVASAGVGPAEQGAQEPLNVVAEPAMAASVIQGAKIREGAVAQAAGPAMAAQA